MRFAEIIKLMAAPVEEQLEFLGEIPENASVPNFDICNDIYRMIVLYLGSLRDRLVSRLDGLHV